jgi:hypothetical protein
MDGSVMRAWIFGWLMSACGIVQAAGTLALDDRGLQLRADDGRELDRIALRAKHWDSRLARRRQ